MNVSAILRIARLSSWTYRILSTVVGMVTIRLIIERIGVAGYGDVAFVLAGFAGISAIDLGFLQALPRFIAHYENQQKADQRPQFLATCVLAGLALFLLQIALVVVLALLFDFIEQLARFDLSNLIKLGLILAVGNLLTASSAIYAGFQHYGLATMAKIMRSLAYLVAIVVLWLGQRLTVEAVLWANVLTTLVANVLTTILLFCDARQKLRLSWQKFPAEHVHLLKEITTFSLFGWLITLSSIIVSSASVIVAGVVLPSTEVANLQIALVLLSGVSAFVTGGMSPLTTIAARHSDESPASVRRKTLAATQLVNETIIFTAVILVFFVNHIHPFIALLLGAGSKDPQLVTQIYETVLVVVMPSIASLPFFVFRFALVNRTQNAEYGRRIFLSTLILLLTGAAIVSATGTLFALASAVGLSVCLRGALAYRMGAHILPGISFRAIFAPTLAALLICEGLSFVSSAIQPGLRMGEFGDAHLQAVLYGIACASLYIFRKKFHPVLGVRLASD